MDSKNDSGRKSNNGVGVRVNNHRRSYLARLSTLIAAPLLAFSLSSTPVSAQETYPNKPIKLIVPFGAGGSADMLARLVGDRLRAALNNPVIVENRPGATGVIGATAVARAEPDGYTLLLVFDGTVSIAPVLQANFPFNPVKDLAPIAKLADVDLVIAANPSVPAKDIKELLVYSKANPGKLSYASPGMGSTAQMAGELMRLKGGMDWVHIPYGASGSGKFVLDVIGGSVPIAFISVAVAAPFIKDNKLVGIGVPSAKRNPAIPNTPTFREVGLTGFDVASWFGLSAPAKTPEPIITRLNQEMKTILADPDVIARLQSAGMSPSWSTPQAMGEIIQSDLARWGEVAKSTQGKI
jgi:tripartite-type tricarboxylate transporter receptor subunit TctC